LPLPDQYVQEGQPLASPVIDDTSLARAEQVSNPSGTGRNRVTTASALPYISAVRRIPPQAGRRAGWDPAARKLIRAMPLNETFWGDFDPAVRARHSNRHNLDYITAF